MTNLEVLLKEYTSMDPADRGGFFLAKVQTIDGYCLAQPMLSDILEVFLKKIASIDGILDINEFAMMQALNMYHGGMPFKAEHFAATLAQFVKDGSHSEIEEAQFAMLPDYMKVDIVMFLIAFACVDGELAIDEEAWLTSLIG